MAKGTKSLSNNFNPLKWLIPLLAMPLNDPLLQTLLEQDRILSKSKRVLESSTSSGTDNSCSKESSTREELQELCVQSPNSVSKEDSKTANLPANIQPIDKEEIIQNRLSLEQIKEIPKFTNYHPGEPNKVGMFHIHL